MMVYQPIQCPRSDRQPGPQSEAQRAGNHLAQGAALGWQPHPMRKALQRAQYHSHQLNVAVAMMKKGFRLLRNIG